MVPPHDTLIVPADGARPEHRGRALCRALVPLVVALAVSTALAPPSGARAPTAATANDSAPGSTAALPPLSGRVVQTSMIRNGGFEKGGQGWVTVGRGGRISVGQRVGVGRSRALVLPVRRSRGTAITDSPNSARGVLAGDRYSVNAWVRGSRPGLTVRLIVSRIVSGRAVLTRTVGLRTTNRRWHRIQTTLTTPGNGGEVDVRVVSSPGPRGRVIVDNVHVTRSRTVTTLPVEVPSPAPKPAPSPTAGQCGSQGKFAPSCGALWGIYTLKGANPAASVTDLEAKVGRRFDITSRYHDFSTHPHLGTFPDTYEKQLGTTRTLFMSWQARVGSTKTNIKWAAIANGQYDSFINSAATRLKAWNRPVIIAFDAEFDNLTSIKGPVADYVRAYRRIVDTFRAKGVTNVAWAWVPTGYLGAGNDARTWAGYPGHSYVDWVGYDPYNFYRCNGTAWKTFERTISPAYNWFKSKGLGGKPFLLSEYGTQYDAGNPAASTRWYSDIPGVLERYPNLKALIRFDAEGVINSGARCNLWLDNGPGMLSAFSSAGRRPVVGYK